MYLRTDNSTVCISITAKENDSLRHSAGFDLCLSRQHLTFSILPPSEGF